MEKFKDIPYARVDPSRLTGRMREIGERMKRAESFERFDRAFLAGLEQERGLNTAYTLAAIRNSMNVGDAFYDAEIRYYNREMPDHEAALKEIRRTVLDSPYRAELEREFGGTFFRDMESRQRLSDAAVVGDRVLESDLCADYSALTANASTAFRGRSCGLYDLLKAMTVADRAERKEAMNAWAALYESLAPRLDGIYDRLVHLRAGMAEKLGFKNYIDMAYLMRQRYEYDQEDVKGFRKQVLEEIVPVCQKLFDRQARLLGVDRLHYYDEAVTSPEGAPVPIGGRGDLLNAAGRMYRELSPETGAFFDFFKEHELFDLESRPGKQGGGYTATLLDDKAPFIFANFNGTSADVVVLTHEFGHAFQSYLCTRTQKIPELFDSPGEICEIPSMSMELFTYPWMEYLFGGKADLYRRSHLFDALQKIPYIVCVDEFQHRVFENPDMTAAERRAVWRGLEKRYLPWRDYDGNAFLEQGGFWMQKLHIFTIPFYYIEYALSQISAFEFYARMKTDRASAWADYCKLCRLGRRLGYTDLLREAGLSNPLKDGAVKRALSGILEDLKG